MIYLMRKLACPVTLGLTVAGTVRGKTNDNEVDFSALWFGLNYNV